MFRLAARTRAPAWRVVSSPSSRFWPRHRSRLHRPPAGLPRPRGRAARLWHATKARESTHTRRGRAIVALLRSGCRRRRRARHAGSPRGHSPRRRALRRASRPRGGSARRRRRWTRTKWSCPSSWRRSSGSSIRRRRSTSLRSRPSSSRSRELSRRARARTRGAAAPHLERVKCPYSLLAPSQGVPRPTGTSRGGAAARRSRGAEEASEACSRSLSRLVVTPVSCSRDVCGRARPSSGAGHTARAPDAPLRGAPKMRPAAVIQSARRAARTRATAARARAHLAPRRRRTNGPADALLGFHKSVATGLNAAAQARPRRGRRAP